MGQNRENYTFRCQGCPCSGNYPFSIQITHFFYRQVLPRFFPRFRRAMSTRDSHLISYLTKSFPPSKKTKGTFLPNFPSIFLGPDFPLLKHGIDTEIGWTDRDLIDAFFKDHGVNVTIEGFFYTFKYSVSPHPFSPSLSSYHHVNYLSQRGNAAFGVD